MFISNSRVSFHLWLKENLEKHQKVLIIMKMIVDRWEMVNEEKFSKI